MPKLIIMVGISGSGKSTFVKHTLLNQYLDIHAKSDVRVVSSDAIREEMFGDESIQKDPEKVFQEAYRRVKGFLTEGKDVILDATNLSRKARKNVLNQCRVRGVEINKECYVILAPPNMAIENQRSRERQTPQDVIYRQMSTFFMPELHEGFDKIVFYNPYNHTDTQIFDELYPKLYNIDQTGKWHVENVGHHTDLVYKAAFAMNAPDDVKEAAWYHDLGKYYTRSEDEKGAHFNQHENVSAYLYLCDMVHGYDISERTKNIARLIHYHDAVYRDFFKKVDFIEYYGAELYDKLVMLRKADETGQISMTKYKSMHLIDLINTFADWRERLKNPPFSMTIRESINEKYHYILLKYNQFATDMSYVASREARGCILKNDNGKYIYVCRPFDKFFNYGEEYVADIDWKTARVTEKVDGSLCKVWYDNGQWHLSTNGTIDAFEAPVGEDDELSFGDIFVRALGTDIQTFGSTLDKNLTYMFELTSPETQVVIPYQDGIYYLSRKETTTGTEYFDIPEFVPEAKIQYPKVYHISNLHDVVTAAQMMSKDEEGFVVNDLFGNRIKVKSPEYLLAAHIRMNGAVTEKRILKLIRSDQLDDFLAYAPEQKEKVDAVLNKIQTFCDYAENEWKTFCENEYATQKDFAEAVKNHPLRAYLFLKRKDDEFDIRDWLFKMPINKMINIIHVE